MSSLLIVKRFFISADVQLFQYFRYKMFGRASVSTVALFCLQTKLVWMKKMESVSFEGSLQVKCSDLFLIFFHGKTSIRTACSTVVPCRLKLHQEAVLVLLQTRLIFLLSFAVNEYMPKACLLCLVFPYLQLFRNWSHSYCVQPAFIPNPKREISFYTYCSIWSNDQMMSKGVFAFVHCGTRRNVFFLCQRNRTNRNWILLDDFNQVSL